MVTQNTNCNATADITRHMLALTKTVSVGVAKLGKSSLQSYSQFHYCHKYRLIATGHHEVEHNTNMTMHIITTAVKWLITMNQNARQIPREGDSFNNIEVFIEKVTHRLWSKTSNAVSKTKLNSFHQLRRRFLQQAITCTENTIFTAF